MNLIDIENFAKNINGTIFFNYEIKKLNWFNIGGNTKIYYKPDSLDELINFLKIYKKRGKIFILGAGSNVLFSDKTFDGVIIKLSKRFNNISQLNENTLIAGSSVLDKNLSEYSKNLGIGGFEFLSCIPGTVGGGIRMNSGCYNREFKDIVISVQSIDYLGNVITIPSKNIRFDYRKTNLSNDLIFLSATLNGHKKSKEDIENEIIKLKKKKEETQPSKVKTGGSTFKNPKSTLKVWELIKNSVPNNIKFGDASISDHHSNFFVNRKNANSEDMINLIDYVKKQVKLKYAIDLELEVVIVE